VGPVGHVEITYFLHLLEWAVDAAVCSPLMTKMIASQTPLAPSNELRRLRVKGKKHHSEQYQSRVYALIKLSSFAPKSFFSLEILVDRTHIKFSCQPVRFRFLVTFFAAAVCIISLSNHVILGSTVGICTAMTRIRWRGIEQNFSRNVGRR